MIGRKICFLWVFLLAWLSSGGNARNVFINMVSFHGCLEQTRLRELHAARHTVEDKHFEKFDSENDTLTYEIVFEGLPEVQKFTISHYEVGRFPVNATHAELERRYGRPLFKPFLFPITNITAGAIHVYDHETEEHLSCVHWGSLEGALFPGPPCDATPLEGVEWGTMWRLVRPPNSMAFRGQLADDFVGGDSVNPARMEPATDETCSFAAANIGQSFVGQNNATVFINEVIVDTPCDGYGTEDGERFNGVELAVYGNGTYLVLVQDFNSATGYSSWMTFDAQDEWSVHWLPFDSFTLDNSTGAELGNFSVGNAMVFAPDGILQSAVGWGKSYIEREVLWYNYEPDEPYQEEAWRFFPMVADAGLMGVNEDTGAVRRLDVFGYGIDKMGDATWRLSSDNACTPGDWNADEYVGGMTTTQTPTPVTTMDAEQTTSSTRAPVDPPGLAERSSNFNFITLGVAAAVTISTSLP